MDISQSQIVSFIWGIADDCLRDVFVRGQYRDVILPMVVLRRFDALLETTKEAVEEEIKAQREIGLDEESFDEGALCDITKLSFYNTSKWTLNRIKSQATDNNDLLYNNFVEYLNGYSENVKDVLRNFDYYNKAKRLADNDRLLSVIEKITDPHINLTDRPVNDPDGLADASMLEVYSDLSDLTGVDTYNGDASNVSFGQKMKAEQIGGGLGKADVDVTKKPGTAHTWIVKHWGKEIAELKSLSETFYIPGVGKCKLS